MSGNKSKTTTKKTTTKKTTSTKETTKETTEKVVDNEEVFVKTELNNIKEKIKKMKDIEESLEKFIGLMPKYLNKKYQTQFYYALDMISFRVSKISNNQLVSKVFNEAKKCIHFMTKGHRINLLDWCETMDKIVGGNYDSSVRNDGRFDSLKKTTSKPKEKSSDKNNENNNNNNNENNSRYIARNIIGSYLNQGSSDSDSSDEVNFGGRSILGNFSNQLNLMMLLNFFTGNRMEHQMENRDFSLGEKDAFVPKFNPPNTFSTKDYPFIKIDKLVFSSPKQVFSFKLDEKTLSSVKESGNLRICFFDISNNSCIVPQVRKLDINKEQLKSPFDKLFDHQKYFGLDISSYCNAGSNKIMIDFKQKNIEAQICLMKKIEVEEVIKELKSIPKESTLELIKKMFDTVDDEVNILSSKLNFECPLSQNIINIPVRGSECAHVNCFDAFYFLTMNKTNPKFLCPVCDKKISSDCLRIDSYMQEIISSVSDLHSFIQFNKDGSYSVIDKKRLNEGEDDGGSSNKKRKIVLDLLDDD